MDAGPTADGDFQLDGDVAQECRVVIEDDAVDVLRHFGNVVVSKGRNGGDSCSKEPNAQLDIVDLIEEGEVGYEDGLFPITVCEQRVAKARGIVCLNIPQHSIGDRVGHGAAEDHRTTHVVKVFRSLHHADEAAVRAALHRLHVKWHRCETERLQSLLRAAGAPPRACICVPPVAQACQCCRPWKRFGQSHKLTLSLAMSVDEEVQLDLMFYRSALGFSLWWKTKVVLLLVLWI